MGEFKKMQNKINKELRNHKNNIDDEGRSIVNITIYNDNDFLSPYSSNHQEILSSETANFIEHSAKAVNPKNPLHINIYSNTIDDIEKEIYPTAIKNYYFNKLIDIQHILNHNLIISILLTLASILVFVLQFVLFDPYIDAPIVSELINIIGWVFMWEAVDQFFIERGKINREKYRYLNIMEAKISFEKLKGSNKK